MGKKEVEDFKSMAAPKLDTEFTCPFCNHSNAVECRIYRKDRFAEASCHVCQESYGTNANALTESVDVYSEWIDACEDANKGVFVRCCRSRLRRDVRDNGIDVSSWCS